MGPVLSTIYRHFLSCFRRASRAMKTNGEIRLPDEEEGKTDDSSVAPKKKRRALLVGISYRNSKSDKYWPLENPHMDVDMYWSLLVGELFSLANLLFRASTSTPQRTSPSSWTAPSTLTTYCRLVPTSSAGHSHFPLIRRAELWCDRSVN